MKRLELVAVIILALAVVAFPAGVLAYQRLNHVSSNDDIKVIDLVARVPESGGWDPEIIRVNKGDTVRLRIVGTDVVHGFAIGGMDIDVGQILPGEPTVVQFVAEEVGRFTYYCNVWCSDYHYRMRGTLEVVDASPAGTATPEQTESQVNLEEFDIDADHEADVYALSRPSATRGKELAVQASLPELGSLRSLSPSDAFQSIKASPAGQGLSDGQIWDLVAYYWQKMTSAEELTVGQRLYSKNCAACHGERGDGNGPGGRSLEKRPTDFTDGKKMAGGSSSLYFAKIRRGGMGTGMPHWGSIFDADETWSIVGYLWTFLFGEAATQ